MLSPPTLRTFCHNSVAADGLREEPFAPLIVMMYMVLLFLSAIAS